jgi:nucleotide-binding universal stress UspA family protein
VIDKLDHEGITVETALEEGRAASGVVSFAQRWSFELIVVGSHGQGGAARTVLGSTAERIVRTSPVPVLVVPTEPPKTEHGATP